MSVTYSSRYESDFPWCAPDPKDTKSARCKTCNKCFRIDTMGKAAFTSHENGKAHKLRSSEKGSMTPLNQLLVKSCADQMRESSAPATNDNVDFESLRTSTPTSSSCSMNKYLINDSVTRAEILWVLSTISTHASARSAGEKTKLFKMMFPDSEIASRMEIGRTKIGYVVSHGLAPYFLAEILRDLENCSEIVIGFDETLNKISQHQQMDIGVRFFNNMERLVESRYLGSVFLSSTKSNDLLAGLKSCLKDRLLSKVIQLSMDGPHVNWKLNKELCKELKEERGDPEFNFINIGSCGLHVVHNSFKNGMKQTNWNIDEFLVAIHQLLKDFPLRRAEYRAVTQSNIFPLKFCGVRWVENAQVARRANEMLPSLKLYVAAVRNQAEKKIKEHDPTYKRSFPSVSKSKWFLIIEKIVSDPMIGAKIAFFISSAASVEPFLKAFQSDAPMAPFLHEELSNLCKSILKKIVKPELLTGNAKSLVDIDLSEKNMLPVMEVDIGFSAKAAIRQENKHKKIAEQKVLMFRNECKAYFLGFMQKMNEKSPLAYSMTRNISCINPNLIAGCPDVARKRLQHALESLVENGHLSGTEGDRVMDEYAALSAKPSFKKAVSSFQWGLERLDVFWFNLLSESGDYINFSNFLKKILILSHGNAAQERGFSVNKQCLVENLEHESLVSQRHVYDAIITAGGVEKVNINKSMIQSCRNARTRYQESLNRKNIEQDEKIRLDDRKRENLKILKDLESKKIKLLANTEKEVALLETKMDELKKC